METRGVTLMRPLLVGAWVIAFFLLLTQREYNQGAGAVQSGSSTPTPKLRLRPLHDGRPLPDGCNLDDVVDLYQRFVSGFNDGDETALTSLIPFVSTRSAAPESGKFTFFAVADPKGTEAVYTRADVLSFVATRHAHSERWTILRMDLSGSWWKGGVGAVLDLSRVADDLEEREVGVQASVDCHSGTIAIWAVGDRPIVPESWFDATPDAIPYG